MGRGWVADLREQVLVRDGWALAYRRYSVDYVDEEAEAEEFFAKYLTYVKGE